MLMISLGFYFILFYIYKCVFLIVGGFVSIEMDHCDRFIIYVHIKLMMIKT